MVAYLLVAVLVTLLCGYVLWHSTYWRRNGVRGPNGMPLCGNMWTFLLGRQHYGDVYEHIYNAHPELPYVGIYRIFNEPAILVRSQQLLKEVLVRSFHHFQDNVLWIDAKHEPIICCNPFVAKGEKWRQMRAEIVPIFTPNKVKSSFMHIKEICGKLKAFVDQHMTTNCFEAKDLFSKFTLDVVASAAYSLNAESFVNSNSDFTQLVDHLFLPNSWSLLETISLLFSPMLGKLIGYRYVPAAVQDWLRTIIGSVLQQRLRYHSATSGAVDTRSDFLQWLIEAKQKVKEPLDFATVVGHCATFLLEGFETSSSLMAFALFQYAVNPKVQQRVLNEIDEVLSRYNGELSYEALQDLSYCEATLFETLRLHPPMLALLKHCTKSIELPAQDAHSKPFVVPVGMVFVIPVKALHYDADLFPDPLEFKPERFATPNERQRMGCKFLGFGEGPRMCPGMRFGLTQSKAGLVTLLSKYAVRLANRAQLPLKISPTTFLTAAKDGVWISFEPRQAKQWNKLSNILV